MTEYIVVFTTLICLLAPLCQQSWKVATGSCSLALNKCLLDSIIQQLFTMLVLCAKPSAKSLVESNNLLRKNHCVLEVI